MRSTDGETPAPQPIPVSSAIRNAFATVADVFERRRWLAVLLSVEVGVILVAALAVHLAQFDDFGQRVGIDFRQYTAATSAWIDGHGFYHSWQLAGPYPVPPQEYRANVLPVLYPPPMVLLLLPFSAAPILAPLWWILPIGITSAVVCYWRPAPWSWPLLTMAALSADSVWLTISGNPGLWMTAALALATVWKWPAVVVLLKPSLALFALVGIKARSWWISLGIVILVTIPFGGMWIDFLTALRNTTGTSLFHSVNNVPMMLIPLIAWAARRR